MPGATKPSGRKQLKSFGSWGERVLVVEDRGLIRVEWREHGRRRRKSWMKSAENRKLAIAWASGFSAHRGKPIAAAPLTMRELWDRYIQAQTHLRPRTIEIYLYRWRKLELFVGRGCLVKDVTGVVLDELRAALGKQGTAPNQIALVVRVAQIVFNWAEEREIIDRNPVGRYKFKRSKDEANHKPSEFRVEDFTWILRQWDPTNARQWRPWAVTNLIGHQGVRENAALHLRWSDVDLEEGWITWPAEFDKVGREWPQPIRAGARSALFTALEWREKDHYTGPWVFYSSWGRKGPDRAAYGVQAYWKALTQAEADAGIEHQPYRSAHGFRRMVVGEITKLTGNPVYALQFVGDKDLKLANTYIKERPDALVAIAQRLDADGTELVLEESGEGVSC